MSSADVDCIFCNIVSKGHSILFQNELVTIIEDVKPASTLHYLSIPVQHRPNAKFLCADDIDIIKEMYNSGVECLTRNGADPKEARIGFHWSPYNSIDHLHMHLIWPKSDIKTCCFFTKYTPSTPWFKTVDWALEYLRKKGRNS